VADAHARDVTDGVGRTGREDAGSHPEVTQTATRDLAFHPRSIPPALGRAPLLAVRASVEPAPMPGLRRRPAQADALTEPTLDASRRSTRADAQRVRTSAASRSASPTKLNASTDSTIMAPGASSQG